MRPPVPRNKLVAFTLLGAVLTAAVAGGLALSTDPSSSAAPGAPQQAAPDAPTPIPNFTPDVQRQSGYPEEEHEEHEEHDEDHEADEYEESDEDEEEAEPDDDEHDDHDEDSAEGGEADEEEHEEAGE